MYECGVNKILNISFIAINIFFGFIFFYQGYRKLFLYADEGLFYVGIFVMLLLWTILAIIIKLKLKLPFSPKNEYISKIYLAPVILNTLFYPFAGYGLFHIAFLFLICGTTAQIFLRESGYEVLIEAKQLSKIDILKCFLPAVIGAYIGYSLTIDSTIVDNLIYGYIGASSCFGFSVMLRSRIKSKKSLLKCITDEEEELDAIAWHAILIHWLFWFIISTPIGAMIIPYYLYLLLKLIISPDNSNKVL